ncbi:MAG: MerR family transcriptional regulator [Glycomyces artemisiae]|uniref:MerR family transcriptional regulator n=1 Tax=Glycomyces artemisiae TaxID=1076443 RepID=A0A850CGS4_9ACTN|nr:MerR family transcriptional regulator [Glycomyces artemisiae]
MLIGELSRRTGVSTRLLRYYEEQELLVPQRDSNGYRSYAEDAPAAVEQIRAFLDAGLTTRAIRELMPCLCEKGMRHCDHSRAVLDDGLDRLDQQIAALTEKRTLLADQVDDITSQPLRPGPS